MNGSDQVMIAKGSTLELVKYSWGATKPHLFQHFAIDAIATLPALPYLFLVSRMMQSMQSGTLDPTALASMGSSAMLMWLGMIVLGPSLGAAAMLISLAGVDGRAVGVADAIKFGFSRWGAMFGLGLRQAFGMIIRLPLLIVPAYIYLFRTLTAPFYVLEGATGRDALRMARERGAGYAWPLFLVSMLMGVLIFPAFLVVSVVLGGLATAAQSPVLMTPLLIGYLGLVSILQGISGAAAARAYRESQWIATEQRLA